MTAPTHITMFMVRTDTHGAVLRARALDAVPAGTGQAAVRDALPALPGVDEVHDLHIWTLSTSSSALTTHLVADAPGAQDSNLPERAYSVLHEWFGTGHATVQVEAGEAAARYRLRSCDTAVRQAATDRAGPPAPPPAPRPGTARSVPRLAPPPG